jgi:hypothetical protein
MPFAVPLLVGAAVYTKAAAAIGTAILGTTVSSAIATAVGAGVVGTAAGLATGQKFEDALKTGVISGLTAGIGGTIGAAIAPGSSAVAQSIIGGSITGAAAFSIAGGDPLKGAIAGAIGSVTSTSYAPTVGKFLGATTDAAAKTIGNAAINAGLSGVQAAVTGGNIQKSMLTGAVAGALIVNAKDFTESVLGAETVKGVENLTNLKESDVHNLFTNAVLSGVVAGANNQDVFKAFSNNLISAGLSQSLANAMEVSFRDAFVGREEDLAGIISTVSGISRTAINAELYGEDVEKALENAMPGIILSSFQAYETTRTAREERERLKAEEQKKLEDQLKQINELAEFQNEIVENVKSLEEQRNNLITQFNTEYDKYKTLVDKEIQLRSSAGKAQAYAQQTGDYSELNFYNLERDNVIAKANAIIPTLESLNTEFQNVEKQINDQVALFEGNKTRLETLSTTFNESLARFGGLEQFSGQVVQTPEQRASQKVSPLQFQDLSVLLAGPVSPEILSQLQSMPLVGELIVGEEFIDDPDPDIGGRVVRTVQGIKNDGTAYSYEITTFEDGNVLYSFIQNKDVLITGTRPELKNAPVGTGDVFRGQEPFVIEIFGTGDAGVGQPGQLPLTGLIDLRTAISNLLPTGQVVFSKSSGVVGRPSEKASTGFTFIGKDGSGRDRFQIGDVNFTVISLDGKNVLANDQFDVFLEPVVNPVTKKPELQPTPESEPFNPPQQEPAPTPEPTPTPVQKTTPVAPREEGQTGVEGATGVAGGAPSGPSQPAPSLAPAPGQVVQPQTPIPEAPAPTSEQARRAAEEERMREEMARQQAEAAAAQQARLEQERLATEEAARVAKTEAERKAAEAEAKRIAEEQARIAEQERIAREEAERARKAAEKLEADVRSSKSAVEQVISTVTPSDFQIPEPVASLDQTSYKFGTEDLGRFSEQQTAYQDTAKQIQNEIDNLVSVKDQVSLIFDSFDPAVKERLRPEFDARVKDLDSQINNLVSQKNQASNLAEQTIKEMQEAERFLEQIRQERTGKVETARGVRTEREQAQYEREQAQFEKDLKNLEAAIAKARSDEEKAQARQLFSTQQRERLRETGRLTGGLQAQINAELGNLLDQYEDAQRRAGRAVTQKEGLVAPQQPGDAGRGISDQDVIDLLGLDRGTAERYGFFGDTDGVAGGLGPGAGVEGGGVGAGVEGAGPGAAEEGVGPGAGEEGFGPGGGAEDVITRLRPIVIYDQKTGQPRATQGIPQRVTAQSVEGILGDKEPLFGGDDDEQRAIWNRRSLRLRKALGL